MPASTTRNGPGFWSPGFPHRLFRYGDNRISRVPVRPSRCMPCSHQTPAGPERQAIQRSRCCLPLLTRRRLPRIVDFGAQSHGLHLRCLRFATTVTRVPRKTRFRAAADLTRAGLDPQDLFGRFPSDSSHVISSPFPELCSAHARRNDVNNVASVARCGAVVGGSPLRLRHHACQVRQSGQGQYVRVEIPGRPEAQGAAFSELSELVPVGHRSH